MFTSRGSGVVGLDWIPQPYRPGGRKKHPSALPTSFLYNIAPDWSGHKRGGTKSSVNVIGR